MRQTTLKPKEWITDDHELVAMRAAGRLVALAHRAIKAAVTPGISTLELDAIAESVIRNGGGVPAFKGYNGFPATVCASPNEVVVHGFPNRRKLVEGDIVTLDIGAIVDGHFGDSAWTHAVGTISPEAARLLAATEAALWAGIAAARAGARVVDISAAIEDVAVAGDFGLIKDYCGHGIGRILHGRPQILNCRMPGPSPTLVVGQGLAIEPMFTLGTDQTQTKRDGWTVVTADRSLAAHFEHTLLVRDGTPEVLTVLDTDEPA